GLLQSGGSLSRRRSQRNAQFRSRLITQQREQPGHGRRLAGARTTRKNANPAQCADGSSQLLAVRFIGTQAFVVEQSAQGSRQPREVDLWGRRSEAALQLDANQLLLLPVPL